MTGLPVPETQAHYKITVDAGCLRAELRNWGPTDEVKSFLWTITATCRVLDHGRVLISIDSSNPMSMLLESPVFFPYLGELWANPLHKIALLSAAPDAGARHAHTESFARRRGVNIRNFDDETAALRWVRDRRLGREQRQAERPPYPHERRQRERRNSAEAYAPA